PLEQRTISPTTIWIVQEFWRVFAGFLRVLPVAGKRRQARTNHDRTNHDRTLICTAECRMSAPREADHARNYFSCDSASLDTYPQRQASQDMKRRVAVCFGAVENASGMVAGVYTLSAYHACQCHCPCCQARDCIAAALGAC
ncbi:MAG: hypothetical protein WCC57_09780, partial [Paracoccaceae bacterium]